MVCDLFQGILCHPHPFSLRSDVLLDPSHAVLHSILPGLSSRSKWKQLLDSLASEWDVFLTMPTLRDRFPQNLSCILQVPDNNFWGFTMSNAEWTPKDIYNILRVYITKLGCAYSMKVLFVLKGKRGGKKSWGEGRKMGSGGGDLTVKHEKSINLKCT